MTGFMRDIRSFHDANCNRSKGTSKSMPAQCLGSGSLRPPRQPHGERNDPGRGEGFGLAPPRLRCGPALRLHPPGPRDGRPGPGRRRRFSRHRGGPCRPACRGGRPPTARLARRPPRTPRTAPHARRAGLGLRPAVQREIHDEADMGGSRLAKEAERRAVGCPSRARHGGCGSRIFPEFALRSPVGCCRQRGRDRPIVESARRAEWSRVPPAALRSGLRQPRTVRPRPRYGWARVFNCRELSVLLSMMVTFHALLRAVLPSRCSCVSSR